MSAAARVGVVLAATLVGVLLGGVIVPRVAARREHRTTDLDALWGFCLDMKPLPRQAEQFFERSWAYGQSDGTELSEVELQAAFDLCALQHVNLEPVLHCQRARDLRCMHVELGRIYDLLPRHVVRKPRHEDEP